MKKLIVLCLLIALASVQVFSQSRGKASASELQITGLKLGPGAMKTLREKIDEKSFYTIDREGMIRPAKGFSIRYSSNQKKVFITQRKGELPPVVKDGTVDLGQGIRFRCYSYDNCLECLPQRAANTFYCPGGGCQNGCFGDVILPASEVQEYQTPTGNYRGGDLQ